MALNQIKELDNGLVNKEIMEEIETSEFVADTDIVGNSAQYLNATWVDVQLTDGTSIDVFFVANNY